MCKGEMLPRTAENLQKIVEHLNPFSPLFYMTFLTYGPHTDWFLIQTRALRTNKPSQWLQTLVKAGRVHGLCLHQSGLVPLLIMASLPSTITQSQRYITRSLTQIEPSAENIMNLFKPPVLRGNRGGCVLVGLVRYYQVINHYIIRYFTYYALTAKVAHAVGVQRMRTYGGLFHKIST